MDVRSDEELLRATPREAAAFGRFYERNEAAIAAYFMRRVANAELAADLTAETFAAALVSAGRFRGKGAALAWLYGIARHVLARSLERQRVEDRARRILGVRMELTDDVLVRFEQLAGDAGAAVLLDELAPEQAAAVRARVLDEDSYADIAARIQCSESVVRQRVSRGLNVLRSRKGVT